MSWENSLLVRFEILELFGNTLTINDKYFCHNREKFWQTFQMHLSIKPAKVCQILIRFLKSRSNFDRLEKTDETQSLSIFKIIYSQRGGYLNV